MVQLFIAFIIVLIGLFVFKFYPIDRKNTTNMILAAIFIMITVIAKRFLTVMIPLFGLESLKIGLEYIPLMIAGYFLSPGYTFLIGLSSDLIGLILVPTGFPFFGFTLTMILVCLIPSLIKTYIKDISANKVDLIVKGFISILGISGILYIYFLEELKISDTIYTLTMVQKIPLMIICFLLILLFVFIIEYLKKRISTEESKNFSLWILSVISVEVFCTLFLSPLWLNIMYGIPFIVSFCIRVIKECFVIPLEIFLGFTIIKVLKRIFMNKI